MFHGTVSSNNVILQPLELMMVMSGRADVDRTSGGIVLGGFSVALRFSRSQKVELLG